MKSRRSLGKAAGGLIQSVQGQDNDIKPRADPSIRINPNSATADRNTVRGMAPTNPADNQQGLFRGGKVTKVVKMTPRKSQARAKGKR